MAEHWVRTSETEDVAGSLRHAIRAAQGVTDDPQEWKWVVISLHLALQGACVCHLTTTTVPVGAVTQRNAAEWLEYLERSSSDTNAKPPTTQLMGLPDLLKAVRKPHSAGDRSNDIGVMISDSELEWLVRFHREIRNQFAHFEPVGWSIEMSGIPEIAVLIARIIGEILDMSWGFRHATPQLRSDIRRSLRTLTSLDWPSSNDNIA